MTKKTDFFYTNEKDIHFIRPIEIIKEHPEVRELIGRNPYTIFAIIGLISIHAGLAYLSYRLNLWWMVFVLAYFGGAFLVHALFVMVHECSHNLLFQKKQNNMLAGILANTVMFFPSSVSFQRYHLKHHAHQGIPEYDGDLPSEWEAKLFNSSFFGKAIWLLIYPVVQTMRIPRLRDIKPFDKWVALNLAVVIGVDVAAWYFFGPMAFVYLFASMFFSVGLHPLGARWVQEHYLTSDDVQETHSYYGPLNTIAFNVGYHNEHHDFPSIPWNNLPKVRKAGAKWYNAIAYHNSWTLLWIRFLFDKNISIYSRMLRKRHDKPVKQS
ncbi:MAG TPA: fatty acid desaturase [Bacteroidia bacterium]|nr:fatty acid desaturase [Bacteroidia bacterium]